MGLDGVEIVMEVEKTFGIALEEEETSHVETVGDMFELVLSKLEIKEDDRCLSSMAFYHLRRALMEEFNIPRKAIRLETPFEELVPAENRLERWQDLEKRVGVSLSRLVLPRPIEWGIGIASFVVAAASGLATALIFHKPEAGFVFIPVFLVTLICLHVCYDHKRVVIPYSFKTVRDAVLSVLTLNIKKFRDLKADWGKEEVWHIIRGIIVERLRVDPSEVTPSARFYQDLGV